MLMKMKDGILMKKVMVKAMGIGISGGISFASRATDTRLGNESPQMGRELQIKR